MGAGARVMAMRMLLACALLVTLINVALIKQAKTDVAPATNETGAPDAQAFNFSQFMGGKGKGAANPANFSKFMGGKGKDAANPANFSQFMGGKGKDAKGFDFSKYTGGKSGTGGKGFDFSKYTGGKSSKGGKGFDFSKYMGGAPAPAPAPAPAAAHLTIDDLRGAKAALDAGLISVEDYTKAKDEYMAGLLAGDKKPTTVTQPQAGFTSNAGYLKSIGMKNPVV